MKKSLSIILALVIALSAFSVLAFATDGGSITVGKNIKLFTGDWTDNMTVTFTPKNSGFYAFEFNDSYYNFDFSIYQSNNDYVDCSWQDDMFLCKLTAGKEYTLIINNYYDNSDLSFDLSYLGSVNRLYWAKFPKTKDYVIGIDTWDYYDEETNKTEYYLTGFDMADGKAYAEFSGGKVLDITSSLFNPTFNEKPKAGKMMAHMDFLGIDMRVQVTLINNPVKSIEVVTAPTKVYTYGNDTYHYYLDITGMVLKINYTNGKSKTVVIDENDDNYGSIDGHYIYADLLEEAHVGKIDAEAVYLGHSAPFTVTVAPMSVGQFVTGVGKGFRSAVRSTVNNTKDAAQAAVSGNFSYAASNLSYALWSWKYFFTLGFFKYS